MGVNRGGIEDYFHFNRNTCSIVMPDRDVMLFWTDYCKSSSTPSTLSLTDFDGNVNLSIDDDLTGKNLLFFGRVNNTEIVGINSESSSSSSSSSYQNQICPGTIVPWTDGNDIFPFMNIFDYNMSFDKTSNQFTLVFWCNMRDSFSSKYYDIGSVYEEYNNQGGEENEIWDWDVVSGLSEENLAKRHMFVATGTLKKYSITGGGYSGTDNSGWNFIPIFNQPIRINLNNEYDDMPSYPVYPKVYQVTSVGTSTAQVKPITSGGTLIDINISVNILSD